MFQTTDAYSIWKTVDLKIKDPVPCRQQGTSIFKPKRLNSQVGRFEQADQDPASQYTYTVY
jgi:hypothetical protein